MYVASWNVWLRQSSLEIASVGWSGPRTRCVLRYAAKVNDEQRTAPICYFVNCNKVRYFELLVKV